MSPLQAHPLPWNLLDETVLASTCQAKWKDVG